MELRYWKFDPLDSTCDTIIHRKTGFKFALSELVVGSVTRAYLYRELGIPLEEFIPAYAELRDWRALNYSEQ